MTKTHISHRGTHHGQSDFTLTLHECDATVGHLDYSVYLGVPEIQYVVVLPAHRRRGYGTELVRALQAEFPEQQIKWGVLTDDGAALRNSLPVVLVADPAVAAARVRLNALKGQRDVLMGRAQRYRKQASVSQSQVEEFHRMIAPLNDLGDSIAALEQALAGRSDAKCLITFDEGVVPHMKEKGQMAKSSGVVTVVEEDGDLMLVSADGTRFDQSDMERMKRPTALFATDTAEFYRWYEFGGKARPRPLDAKELSSYLVGECGYSPPEAEDAVIFASHARHGDVAVWNAIANYLRVTSGPDTKVDECDPQAENPRPTRRPRC